VVLIVWLALFTMRRRNGLSRTEEPTVNGSNPFRDLRFERETRPAIPRWSIVVGSLAIFTLLWLVLPRGVFYWLFLPVLALLVWIASFGLRRALSAVHEVIHHLEEL
jgi:fatty acid desaturase